MTIGLLMLRRTRLQTIYISQSALDMEIPTPPPPCSSEQMQYIPTSINNTALGSPSGPQTQNNSCVRCIRAKCSPCYNCDDQTNNTLSQYFIVNKKKSYRLCQCMHRNKLEGLFSVVLFIFWRDGGGHGGIGGYRCP